MIEISTDKSRLNIEMIQSFLSNSYWGKGRRIEDVQLSIDSSLNFGMYQNGEQIGFARVVTDYLVFAMLLDVFILPEYRAKGYSKQLMKIILEHSELEKVKTWLIKTKDAHGLYQQFGFTEPKYPEKIMEKIVK